MADIQLPASDLVESATHELLNGQPNWGANIQLADMINSQPQQAPLVLTALKKRLGHKKHAIGLLAIILLESLMKNASRNLLPLIATEDFMTDLVKTLPKQVRDPNNKSIFSSLKDYARDIQAVERFDKVLLCIEAWAKTFSAKFPIFGDTYRNLQRAGVKFPAPELDELAPISTPPPSEKVMREKEEEKRRSLAELEAAERERQAKQVNARREELMEMARTFRDPDARSAIETATLFMDTLSQTPEGQDPRRNDLVLMIWDALKPLARKLQPRLSALALNSGGDESTLAEILQANDVCMEAGLYYEGLVNGTMKRRPMAAPTPTPSTASSSTAQNSAPASSATRRTSSISTPAPVAAPVAAPTEKEKKKSPAKSIPILQPPPEVASSTPSRKHRSSVKEEPQISSATAQSSASSIPAPIIPAPVVPPQKPPKPVFDLLSFASPPPPQPQPQSQPVLPISQFSGREGSPAKSSFVLAPPPSASSNIDFFAPTPNVPAPAPSSFSSNSSLSSAPSSSAASSVSSFPPPRSAASLFGEDDDDDPFLALATRGSPAAAQSGASHAPSSAPKKKSVAEEFDLLSM